MPEDYDYHFSRTNRFEKRRKNKKLLLFFSISAMVVFVLFFVIQTITSDSPDKKVAQNQDDKTQEISGDKPNDPLENGNADEQAMNDSNDDAETTSNDTSDQVIELKELEVDDELVTEAYTANWEPVQTVQSEPHEISWEQDSQDWKEMLQAAQLATGLDQEEISYLWVSGNGPQKVIATFSNQAESEHYRVYLSWIENTGWQPTRVDHLKENDQKYRFDSISTNEQESDENDNEEIAN
ncbi:hypothetical protein BN1058_01206 [Paraliobacillus sp. PM-2]|uniref:YrrS family protein n=1 Tax=Paraliobacillus sp. PM-2 TaxID=1462524 RepID=UPI00061CB3E4|nr:YrrS family protein [Paraliobacillus sp. PM-2]CQR46922.1 hypothetical protein BN1058_01206 [Paraliobacillus sp. PM-2]